VVDSRLGLYPALVSDRLFAYMPPDAEFLMSITHYVNGSTGCHRVYARLKEAENQRNGGGRVVGRVRGGEAIIVAESESESEAPLRSAFMP
jgi:hypothetical protein